MPRTLLSAKNLAQGNQPNETVNVWSSNGLSFPSNYDCGIVSFNHTNNVCIHYEPEEPDKIKSSLEPEMTSGYFDCEKSHNVGQFKCYQFYFITVDIKIL